MAGAGSQYIVIGARIGRASTSQAVATLKLRAYRTVA